MKDNGSICKISVDGTDFRIYEPKPFDSMWYSHKFRGPGVRYEVGVCIQTGWIVWINGPFPCGTWPDLRIARSALIDALDSGEKYLADGGYKDGGVFAVTPNGLNSTEQQMKKIVRARHETVNRRLKQFNALHRTFRHNVSRRHSSVFRAVANITQLMIENNEPLFCVDYNDKHA